MTDPVSFSLPDWDTRFFTDYDARSLSEGFIDWLERFVGPYCGVTTDGALYGKGWDFTIIHTTGWTDRCLTIDEPKHAAMFKLIYGIDVA